MKSPLSCPYLISYTVVSSRLLNEHLRCSPSLLPASTATLYKGVGCPAHWGCRDWLTSQEHQPGHCGTAALDGGEMGRVCQKGAELTRKGRFPSALSLFLLHSIWRSGVSCGSRHLSRTEGSSSESSLQQPQAVGPDKWSIFYLPQLQAGKMSWSSSLDWDTTLPIQRKHQEIQWTSRNYPMLKRSKHHCKDRNQSPIWLHLQSGWSPSLLSYLLLCWHSSALPPSWKFSLASVPRAGLVASYPHRAVSISPPAIQSLVQSSLQLFLYILLTLVCLIILPTVWSKDVITTAAVLSHRN